MNFAQVYTQISNNASVFAIFFLIAVALWILAIQKIDRVKK